MNVAMFWRALRDLRWTIGWYALGLILYGVMILSFYPTVKKNSDLMQQYLAAMPAAMKRVFNLTDLTNLPSYVGVEYLSLIWPLIVAVFAIMSGAAVVAQEIERGTVELWLSVPERRWRLLGGKVVAILIGSLALTMATILALDVGAALVGESFSPGGLLAVGLVLLSFGVAVAGYAILFSAAASERGRPAGLAAGLTLLFYLAWVIGGLSERWSWLKRLSIFSAFQPQEALASGRAPVAQIAVLLVLGLGCVVGAAVVFERRNAVS